MSCMSRMAVTVALVGSVVWMGWGAVKPARADEPATGQNARPPAPTDAAGSSKVKTKKVTFLGVAAQPIAPETAAQLGLPQGVGLTVRFVSESSPAAKSGLQVHDVLYKLDDQLLINAAQLGTLVRIHQPGDTVKLTVYRHSKSQVIPVVLGRHEVSVGMLGHLGRGQAIVTGPNGQMRVMELPQLPEDVQKMLRQAFPDLSSPPDASDGSSDQSGGSADTTEPKPHAGKAPAPAQPPVKPRTYSESTVTMMMNDREHKLRLTVRDGVDKTLHVEDQNGKVIFDGLVNTPEQRQELSPEILSKLEKMEKRLPKIRMRFGGPAAPPAPPGPSAQPPAKTPPADGPMM